MSRRTLPHHGQLRPVNPAWLLTPAEIAAMLARPHFLRFRVERRSRRRANKFRRASNLATASHKLDG